MGDVIGMINSIFLNYFRGHCTIERLTSSQIFHVLSARQNHA